MDEQQQQPNISEIMSNFSQDSSSGEGEILRIASNYALQINPYQEYTIMKLKTFAQDYEKYNPGLATIIEKFIKDYLELKHYHESSGFIMRIIDSLSIKKLVPNDAVKVNVMK